MKILLTGASGFLGSKLLTLLLENGYDVVAVIHKRELQVSHPRLSIIRGDLTEINLPPADLAIHAAAMTDVDKCEVDREACWKLNVIATKRIATHYPTLYISTDYVFPGDEGLYRETDIPNPVNFYGLTKLLGEEAVLSNNGWVVRTSGVYGVHGGKVSFPETVVYKLSRGEVVNALIDQWYSPTYSGLLASAIVELLELNDRPPILHIAGPRLSRYEFALAIADVFNLPKELIKPITSENINWIAKRPKDSSLDSSLARSIIKAPFHDLSKSLEMFKKEWESLKHAPN